MVERPVIEYNPVFQSQVRLAIVAALFNQPALGFNALKELTGTTDGNLSTHTQKLEKCGYIQINKRFAGKNPQTSYSLTETGRKAFTRYVESLEKVIKKEC